jgi:DNA-binding transcriptional LysR family regulator
MDIKRLKHLVALADTRNFGRAATQCHLTQSAFSRSIQAAEDELGLQLFDRGTVEASCTDAGAFVVERARKLLFASHCLERDVSLYRERLIGDLAFGVGPFPAATMVPALLTEIRTRYPGVCVQVEVNNADHLIAHLRAEQLDFYMADVRNVVASADLVVTRVARLSAGFYVRVGHPLLARGQINGAALLPYGIASVRLPESVQVSLGALLGLGEGQRLPLAVECDDLTLLKSLAMTTDTVIGSTDGGSVEDVQAGRLVRLEIVDMPALFADMAIVSLKGRSYSLMAQFAVDFMVRQAQPMTQTTAPRP